MKDIIIAALVCLIGYVAIEAFERGYAVGVERATPRDGPLGD